MLGVGSRIRTRIALCVHKQIRHVAAESGKSCVGPTIDNLHEAPTMPRHNTFLWDLNFGLLQNLSKYMLRAMTPATRLQLSELQSLSQSLLQDTRCMPCA